MRMCCYLVLLSAIALQAQDKKIRIVSVQPTPMNSGQEMFKNYCATCHGRDGKGDGPAASALKKAPADLTQLALKHDGKYPDAYVASRLTSIDQPAHGSNEMPVWGPVLSSLSRGTTAETHLRITNIVAYVETLQAK
ncbi:MAG TPA: cytochrome c [Bryobacteraceae bacterium]|nr:cytochrome c [Bryobacteraceae bacterium]